MGLLDDAIREHLELKRRRGADAGDISREESEALGPVRRRPDGTPDPLDPVVPAEPAPDAPPGGPAWDSDETRVLGTAPLADEPPSAAGYEPPPVPARAPPAPPIAPAYQPPPPPPASPPAPERTWYEHADEPAPDPFAGAPAPKPESAPDFEPEPPSLLSRLRVGRKSKQGPQRPPSDEPASSFEPPPLPSSYDSVSPYEPPPATTRPSHGYEPPPVQHEPDIVPADDEPDVEDVLEETPDFLEETPEHDRLWFEQRPPRDFDFDDK